MDPQGKEWTGKKTHERKLFQVTIYCTTHNVRKEKKDALRKKLFG